MRPRSMTQPTQSEDTTSQLCSVSLSLQVLNVFHLFFFHSFKMRSFSLSIFAATVLMMSNLALATEHLELHVSDNLQLNVVEGVVKTDKTMLGHYGHPPDECEEDEIAVQIQGKNHK